MKKNGRHSTGMKAGAWFTHAFTASGMVAGFFAIVFIAEHSFLEAWYCLIAALVIDAVDGTFARLFKVSEVLPRMDGKIMDAVVDFANYALIPAWFIYEAGHWQEGRYIYLLPENFRWAAIGCILIVSVIYYGKIGMISNDLFFIGFPVLWNLVGFYLFFVFQLPPWVNFGIVVFFAVAHFLPLKFIYPSRSVKFLIPNIIATVLIIGSNLGIVIMIALQSDTFWWSVASIVSLCWFAGMSLYHTFFDRDTRMRKESGR